MTDHIYKSLELTGSSEKGIEDAVAAALARASKTMRNIRWIEVKDVRAHIEDDRIGHWQVTMKVGFTLEE